MTPIETLIASNFTETNNTLDTLLREMQEINKALKNINDKLNSNGGGFRKVPLDVESAGD